MALMGCPLYLLYEAGILVIRLLQVDEKKALEKDQAAREQAGNEEPG